MALEIFFKMCQIFRNFWQNKASINWAFSLFKPTGRIIVVYSSRFPRRKAFEWYSVHNTSVMPPLLKHCSVTKSCLTLCYPIDCSTPGFLVLHCLLEFAHTLVHWVSDAIQPSHPLAPPFLLPSIPSIRVFSNESALHIRWPKYWSFSYSISPSSEYSRLISWRNNWFDFLTTQQTLKNILRHYILKASVLCSQPSLWSSSHIRTWLLEKP